MENVIHPPVVSKAYLFVERGAPFRPGSCIPIQSNHLRLGRNASDHSTIQFNDPKISRNHLEISIINGDYFTLDKKSKNGTTINDHPLAYFSTHKLEHGDRIGLANKTVLLVFTLEDDTSTISIPLEKPKFFLSLDKSRREAMIEGKTLPLNGNLYQIFSLLYENPGKAISHAEIKNAVWPDRARDVNGEPITTEEEIHLLIMRLRKKLAPYGHLVNNIRGFGYMLDID